MCVDFFLRYKLIITNAKFCEQNKRIPFLVRIKFIINMKYTSIIFFYLVMLYVNGQQGPCKTVSGGEGRCKSIYKCQPLLELIDKPNRTAQDMEALKRAHCGFDGPVPAVCCPEKAEPTTILSKPSCYTPEGNPGQCVGLHSCPELQNLLDPPVPDEHLQYLERSKCLGTDKYSVCCGPVPHLMSVPKGNCANTVTAFPPDPRTKCCGIDGEFNTKIFVSGGTSTHIDQYPWLVLIEYEVDKLIQTGCGGALISGKYVLTAGHCVVGEFLSYTSPKNIRLSEYDTSQDGRDFEIVENGLKDWNDGLTIIAIESTIPHPQYNPLHPQEKHDIALVRMKEMAPFTDFIAPICLPTTDIALRTGNLTMIAAGWGATSFNKSSAIKQRVELPFVNREQCQRAYVSFGRELSKGQICAGGVHGKDSCKGDSGGPLITDNGPKFEVIGIVSYGPKTCGLEDVPGVYTDVYQYSAWIRSNIVP